MGLKARYARFQQLLHAFWGPSRVSLLAEQVDHLACQQQTQLQLTRELLRDVVHASQAQAAAMQDFAAMMRQISELQMPQGSCERRVSTDETEYQAWILQQPKES